jgi:chromosome segregation protein
MLKLKKVELQGFKSFCDRTELKFNGGGIAAVVGPNGCGKSNLSDAISWVLGEQSAKSLRGARMEDVIFAGTKSRKPLGMASVTMVLVDPEAKQLPLPDVKQLSLDAPATQPKTGPPVDVTQGVATDAATPEGIAPDVAAAMAESKVHEIHTASGHNVIHHPGAKQGEITITRRLFRSGESEYLIDGRLARLRDIQDIFMGSGLGPESYAIIEQGRIGQILSSRPYDRRAVIEEAAGITKYKSRRRLAEAKLESARQNLARVFDILEEVTRQVNSLKRQASKTKRYQELKGELEGQLRTVLAGRYVTLKEEAERSATALEAASVELRDATAEAADQDAARQKTQEVFYALEAQLTEFRRQLAAMNVESAKTRGRLESQVREAASIEQRMSGADRETANLEQQIEQNSAERAALAVVVEGLEKEIQSLRAGLMDKNRTRDEVQARIRQSEQTIDGSRHLILRLLGEASGIRNQIAQADTYLSGIERERARLQKEESAAAAEIERLDGVKLQLSEHVAQRQMEIESVTTDRRGAEEELAARRANAADLRVQIDALRAECSRLRAQRESLENVLSHHSYTTESTKKLLAALENGRVLADFIDVDPAWERATEEFLHDELEYVVVKDWNEAERNMNLLRTELEGRATFLVEGHAPDAGAAGAAQASTCDLPRLTSHVNFTNGLTGQTQNLPRLAQCYLANDRDQARTMADAHPDAYFLLADGESYHGRMLTGGRKQSSGPLVLKRELREYAEQFAEREGRLMARTSELQNLEGEMAALSAELERLRQLQQAREKEAVSLDHDLRRTAEEIHRSNSRVSVARLELDRLKREEDRTHEARARNLALAEQKEAERAERELALEALREQLDAAQSEAQRTNEEHAILRANLAGVEERHRGERTALARLFQHFEQISSRRKALGEDVQRWGASRSRILSENIELDQKLTALTEQITVGERTVLELASDEVKHREALTAADESLRVLRARIETAHTNRGEIEVELTRRQSELQFLDETSRKELDLGVAELEAPADCSPEVLQATETLYQETRAKIESLGAVNPTAYEEFQEAQLRQEFLSSQRQDLLDSIRDTETAIREIDEISKARFSEAFKIINENFRQCFQTLFGGGAGEMRLTDEENVNESGIDMIASPPGKKLQNVLLLSGGEKALTALALLMAIFKYQPSPFCVLDEVDAPLDEANIGRLMRLLAEMSVDTQFVIITHSKKTMESAQAMYGVTMQEAGVSKLVSVRFQHRTAEGAAA